MGNMSTVKDLTTTPEMLPNSTRADEKPMDEHRSLQSFRRKLYTVKARIKYHERTIKGMRQDLQRGTFPKRFKSLKPYPKMFTIESQAIVNAACQQVESVIFDRTILDEEMKLAEDKNLYKTMKEELIATELKDLQTKYDELCQSQSKQ